MFNEERKLGFIETVQSDARKAFAENMFERTEPYESKYGVDVAQMSRGQLLEMLEEVAGSRQSGMTSNMSVLRNYIRWCSEVNVDGVSFAVLEIKKEDIGTKKLKRQFVANAVHLQRCMDAAFEKESEGTIDCIYRAFLWLAYIGIRDHSEAESVTTDEVDLMNMVVHHGGKEYLICREAVPSLKRCVEMKQIVYKHPNYTGVKLRDRLPGDKLLRGYVQNKSDIRICVNSKIKMKKFLPEGNNDEMLNIELSYDRVWLSGRFYAIFEAENAGMRPDFNQMAEERMLENGYDIKSKSKVVRSRRSKIAGEYMIDYERWKNAFGYSR